MPVEKIRGVNINYQVIGERGPWVALITGGRRAYNEFIPFATKIAGGGYRVLLHDRRNTGASEILLDRDEVEEITWADDLQVLLERLGAVPAFVGGSSSGARTSILFTLRHPDSVRALLLLRVTGGKFAAARLPENYYGQFITACEQGGMAAVCATEEYQQRIAANPNNRAVLMAMDPKDYLAKMRRWRELFEAGAHHPVMGVTPQQMASIKTPTIIIPGNDQTHASANGRIAHQQIAGSELHQLPIEDQEVPLIPFPDWAPYEDEIVRVFLDFMRRKGRAIGSGAAAAGA
jgi:pimeloyl-ACP methyl ester carboxylesterase